jgi:arylsulfatase A-like enzyme
LAKGSVVFWNAISQDTQTTPSHASMFTGVYPHVHGSEINGHHLDAKWRTLAQILQRAGFETGGFVSSVTMDGKVTGLDRGFDE